MLMKPPGSFIEIHFMVHGDFLIIYECKTSHYVGVGDQYKDAILPALGLQF